jgi:hypothetical protein
LRLLLAPLHFFRGFGLFGRIFAAGGASPPGSCDNDYAADWPKATWLRWLQQHVHDGRGDRPPRAGTHGLFLQAWFCGLPARRNLATKSTKDKKENGFL